MTLCGVCRLAQDESQGDDGEAVVGQQRQIMAAPVGTPCSLDRRVPRDWDPILKRQACMGTLDGAFLLVLRSLHEVLVLWCCMTSRCHMMSWCCVMSLSYDVVTLYCHMMPLCHVRLHFHVMSQCHVMSQHNSPAQFREKSIHIVLIQSAAY